MAKMFPLRLLAGIFMRNPRITNSNGVLRAFHETPRICSMIDEDGTLVQSSNNEKTINQVTLLGRIGADPVKRGSEEHPVVTFSLATHSSYGYSTGEIVQKTEWHRIVVFKPGLRDVILRYLTKGQRVFVQGRLIYGEVRDGEDQVRTTCSVVADDLVFLGRKES